MTDWPTIPELVGGFNAHPAEVEGFLSEERMGQAARAFVVFSTRRGRTPIGDQLIAWSRRRKAAYKVPGYVEFLDGPPTNVTGEVVKDRLR